MDCADPSEKSPVASTARSTPSTPRGCSGEIERPESFALVTVTEVEVPASRYTAWMVAAPGTRAASRPQLPDAEDTPSTEGGLLDHFTSEVRSAWDPSLKNPVAVALPAVPAAYWGRSATTTRRVSAALLTTINVVPRTSRPAKLI